MFLGIRTVLYHVKDIEQAKQWYSKILGIQPYFDQPYYVGFNVGGYELGLDPDPSGTTGKGGVVAYWGVNNAEESLKELLNRGAKKHTDIQDVGDGIRVASILDPFGNVFGIIENPHFTLEKKIMPDQTGLSRIGQIAITISDIRKAISFYRDTLGMKFLFEVPNMAFFDCGGIRLMLSLPDKEKPQIYSSVIYYKVDNIQQTYDTLSSRDVTFEAKPHLVAKLPDHDLWMAFFRDPDNNLLALMSELEH